MRKAIVFCLLVGITLVACKKEITRIEPDLPPNPFDGIDYTDGVMDDCDIDSSSFLGLHKFIFSQTCAVPACHDGAFEPDFRTIQSAYNTLVYATPIKDVVSGKTFEHRVVPGSLDSSLLHERVTTVDPVLGKMPLYDTLTPGELQAIKDWISGGALDVFGNSPTQANLQPTFFGLLAYDTDTTGVRYDTGRRDFVSPIELPAGTIVQFWPGLYDPQNTDGNFGLGYLLSHNKVKISDHPFTFGSAPEMTMSVEPAITPHYGPTYFDPNPIYPYYHSFSIDTDDYVKDRVYFVRFYVKDLSHSNITEIPEDNSPIYLMTFFSFVVK